MRKTLLLPLILVLTSCPNPFYERVQDLVNAARLQQVVSVPVISPGTGTYSSDQSVSISDATSGAVIHYTLDGSAPAISSPTYLAPIAVAGNGTIVTIKAVAVGTGPSISSVATAVITINYGMVSTPQAAPVGGSYATDQLVTLTCSTPGAVIRYTTDGSTPVATSTVYSTPVSVAGSGTNTTIHAYATKGGMLDSTVSTDAYLISYLPVAIPTIAPAGGRLGHAVPVTLLCTTPGATIVYTTDGSLPAETAGLITHGTLYTVPFTLPYGNTTVTAMAFQTMMLDSGMAIGAFIEPVFVYAGSSSASTSYANQVNLTNGSLAAVGTYPGTNGPQGIAADPAGRFLYVASQLVNAVSAFTINSSTGALASAGVTSPGFPAYSPVVEYTGKFLYVSTSTSNSILGYAIIQATGAITSITGSPFAALGQANGLAASPVAPYLYVAVNTPTPEVQGYSVNTSTGALTAIPGSPFPTSVPGTYGLAVDPTGKFLYAANQSGGKVTAFTINSGTGALTLVGQWSAGNPIAVAIDPSGRYLYAADYNGGSLYGFAINTSTGALTLAPGLPFVDSGGTSPVSLSVEPSGQFLYVAHGTSTGVSVYRINSANGALTFGSSFALAATQSCVTSTGVAQ